MVSIAPRMTALDAFRPDTQAILDLAPTSGRNPWGTSVFDGGGQSKLGAALFNGRDEFAAFRNWSAVAINSFATTISQARPVVGRKRRANARKQQQRPTAQQTQHWDRHYRQSSGETKREEMVALPDHPLAQLFDKINQNHNWEMHSQLTWKSLRVCGQAYWYLPAEANGLDGSTLPGAIGYVPPRWIQPLNYQGQLDGWRVSGSNGQSIECGPDEVLRIYYPDPDDPSRAVSPMRQGEGFIVGSEAVIAMGNQRFERGGDANVMLLPTDDMAALSEEEIRKLLGKLKERMTLANTGLPTVLPPGLTPHNVGQSNRDLELIARDDQLMRAVFAMHGISPMIAGVSKDLNRATAIAAFKQAVEMTFNPSLSFLAGFLTERLASRYEPGLMVWFEAISSDTEEDVIARIEQRKSYGAITPSEVAVAMSGDPIQDPAANVPYMAAGLTPLYQGKGMQPPAAKAEQLAGEFFDE